MINFKKAVKLETAYIDLFGNMVISNLNVSITSDFNDNISLIRSNKTIVGLKFCTLIVKKIVVNSIKLENLDITIHKKYGKSYIENFKEIFYLSKPFSGINKIDIHDFQINLNNANFYFMENFKEHKLTVEFYKVNSEINVYKNKLLYTVEGYINPKRSKEIDTGSLQLKGELLFDKDKNITETRNSIVFDNFDLSYLNSHVNSNFNLHAQFFGGVSTDLSIKSVYKNFSIRGDVDFNNAKIRLGEKRGSHTILSNENLSVSLIVDVLNNFSKFIFRKFDISDNNITINTKGIYCKNKLEEYIDVFFKTNKIDLSSLSLNFTPFKKIEYEGYFDSSGRIEYDIKNGLSKNTSVSMNLNKLLLKKYRDKTNESPQKHLDMGLTLKNNILAIDLKAGKDKSDFKFRSESFIHGWSPFRSDTTASFHSESIDSGLAFSLIHRFINFLYTKAYDDIDMGYKENYEGQSFNLTTAGTFIRNNNLNCSISINRINFKEKARLSSFKISALLKKGQFFLYDFKLSGYDGEYKLGMFCNFDTDSPWIELKGKVKNFNIEDFAKDYGLDGFLSGSLFVELDYNTNAYRPAHIVDNSRCRFYINVSPGIMKSTGMQKRLSIFLNKSGYNISGTDDIKFKRISFLFGQTGKNYYIQQLILKSDRIDLNVVGKYSYKNGIDLPIHAWFIETDENDYRKLTRIPLLISGPLLKPGITLNKPLKQKGKQIEMLIFHSN